MIGDNSAVGSNEERGLQPTRRRHIYLILVGLLWVIHIVMNWLWHQSNITTLGWDRPAHLVRSLEYLKLMQPFSIAGFVDALTWPSFYPPLFHLSVVGFYSVLGVSGDVAAMTNVVYLAVLLFSIYGIGAQMYDSKTGLLAACLGSLFPIVFLMARFKYIEFSMLSLVTLSFFLMLKTDHFRGRGWSYALGISLGLGLLAKWTFIVFAGPPLLYVLLTSPILNDLKDVLKSWRPHWRQWVLAAIIATVGLSLLSLLSGDWEARGSYGLLLAVVYWAILFVLACVNLLPSRPVGNFLGAIATALGVSAIWYIPNSGFISTALYKAFYFGSEEHSTSQFGSSFSFGILFRGLVNEHLSVPVALITVILVSLWLVRKKGKWWPLAPNVWLLGLWLAVPFFFFSTFSNPTSWNMRLTICLVLPKSIILARACLSLAHTWARRAVVATLVAITIMQWLTLSLDSLAWIPDRTRAQLPLWGAANWFAQGEFVQWPESKQTDEDYWVLPSIFSQIEADNAQTQGNRPITLGLLVNQPYLNDYQATFLSQVEHPDIEVLGLFRNRRGLPVYSQIFNLDYVIVSDSGVGDEHATDQSTLLVTAILTDPPEDFTQAFQEIATFRTPNGDVIHLYRNNSNEPPGSIPPKLMPLSIENVLNVNFDYRLLLMGYTVERKQPAEGGKLNLELYWLGLNKMEDDYIVTLKLVNDAEQVWGQQEARPGWGSYPTQEWPKGEAVRDVRQLPVTPGTPPGSYMIELTIYGMHEEDRLSPVDQAAVLLGPIEIARQANLSPQDLDIEHRVEQDLGAKVRLLGYNIESGFRPGDNIHLTLFWQALQSMDTGYTVFCHIIAPDGQAWGQKDNPPAAGFYPTNLWTPGEIVRDQYDILISPEAPLGDYSIHLGMYLPETGERLPVTDEGGDVQDNHITLEDFEIGL